MTIDVSEAEADAAEVAENADTSRLTNLGLEALDIEAKIAYHEDVVKGAKKRLEEIMRHDVPKALAVAGVQGFIFDVPNGGKASIIKEMKVKGTLNNAPDQEEALKYLTESGLPGGPKTTLSIDFAEGEEELADILTLDVAAHGKEAVVVRTINAQSLMAFARLKLEEDPSWDYEKVGLSAWPQAKFTKRS